MPDAFSSKLKFDVITFAKQLLKEIDSVRSYTVGKSDSTGTPTQVPNESRLNAFYRLMGFPMFVTLKNKNGKKLSDELSNVNHLTPGYVTHFDKSEHPLITGKISVSDSKEVSQLTVLDEKGANTKLNIELLNREGALLLNEAAIGTEIFNNRMVEAFYEPMALTYFDKKSTSALASPSTTKDRNRYKKIIPFITMAGPAHAAGQPLWDIYPKRNMLSKPFVLHPDLQKIDSQTTLKRPFIESVIRIRSVNEGLDESEYYETVKSSLKADGVSLPDSGTLLEAFILSKLTLSLRQLAKKWVNLNARKDSIIKKGIIKFAPVSGLSKSDPLGKRSFKSPTVKAQAGTELGARLLKIRQAIAEREGVLSLLPTDNSQTTKKKGTNTVINNNISANALTSPFVSILSADLAFYKKELAKVQKEIKEAEVEADKIRYQLELMTGEFLGISICDIVCIIIAMFVVEKKYLIGLLDDYVKTDMMEEEIFEDVFSSGVTVGVSLTKLEKALDDVYNLLNLEIGAIGNKSKRTKKTDKKNSSSKSKIINKNIYSEQRVSDLVKEATS